MAVVVFEFHLPSCRGLKEKRSFLRPLKTRIRGDFAISAAEVAHQDLLQRATLGVAAVGPDRAALEPLLEKVLGFVESYTEEMGAELASARREFLVYGEIGSPQDGFGEGEEESGGQG